MNKNILIALTLLLVPFLYLGLDYFINQQGDIPLPPAPVLRMKDLQGQVYELQDFKERLVVLNFWATWCPPCLNELPQLAKIAKLHGKEITVLAVLTSDELSPHAMKIIRDLNAPMNMRFMLDHENAAKAFGTNKLPETYIIDRNRQILEKISGDITLSDKNLSSLIKRHLQVP